MQTVSGPEQLEALPFQPPTVLGLLGIMMISVMQVRPAHAHLLVRVCWIAVGVWIQACTVPMPVHVTGRHPCIDHRDMQLGLTGLLASRGHSNSQQGSHAALTGLMQVIQFTITMFITMLIARGQRAVIDKDENSKVVAFDSLLGLLLVMYPLVNMGAQMLLSGEIMLRRFMYYRLLSLQVRHAVKPSYRRAADSRAALYSLAACMTVL
jgi:hypothetical protein